MMSISNIDDKKNTLIKSFQEIVKVNGDKAVSSNWLRNNGHAKLKANGMRWFGSWTKFVEEAGFKPKGKSNKKIIPPSHEDYEIKEEYETATNIKLDDLAERRGISVHLYKKAILRAGGNTKVRRAYSSINTIQEESIINQAKEGKGFTEISKNLNISYSVVERVIKNKLENWKSYNKDLPRELSKEELDLIKDLYISDVPLTEIGSQLSISAARVKNVVIKLGCEKREYGKKPFIKDLLKLYEEGETDKKKLAKIFSISVTTVLNILKDKLGDQALEVVYWNKDKVKKYAEKLINEHGSLPTRDEMKELGHAGFNVAINRHYPGGYYKLLDDLGQKIRQKKPQKWNRKTIKKYALKLVSDLGGLPTTLWLNKNDHIGFVGAIARLYDGGINQLRKDLKVSLYTEHKKKWSKETVIEYAKKLIEKFGELPTKPFLDENGERAFSSAVYSVYEGGINQLRKDLGQPILWESGARIERTKINYQSIKKLLKSLKQQNQLKALQPREIYILLQQNNLLNLPNREGGTLIKGLISNPLTIDGLEEWIDSEDEIPNLPLLNKNISKDEDFLNNNEGEEEDKEEDKEQEIKNQNNTNKDESNAKNELPDVETNDALNLLNSNIWATDDSEAAESLICSALDKVWNHAYKDEKQALKQLESFQGNEWCETLRSRFLKTYNNAKKIKIPENYIFPHPPRLMQKVSAAEANERSRLLILSGMGLGKTLASALATRTRKALTTWVICPNNTINSWERGLKEQWSDIEIKTKKIDAIWETNNPHYLLINYEQFSLLNDEKILEIMESSCPDAFIIDEIQFAKQRTKDYVSKRRTQIGKCLTIAGNLNKDLMVIGMSGTPILNNLMEGKKLIELIFGEERNDLQTSSNVHNAMRMFQEFTRLGIRQRGSDIWPISTNIHQIDSSDLLEELKELRRSNRNGISGYEKILCKAKIPKILQLCKKQPSIIVTEYIEGIVEPIRKELEENGLKVGIYTGKNKLSTFGGNFVDSIEEFKAGITDVLIGSGDCLGTGIDGLQDRCYQLIYASLPWTDGDNAQIQARLARERQEKVVQVHIPQTFVHYTTIDGASARWSFCEWRWSVIGAKRAIAEAAVDGISPREDNRLTPSKALNYIDGWLARLEQDEVLKRHGRQIQVPLEFLNKSEEIKIRGKFGDFNNMNARWNRSNSSLIHKRLCKEPKEWELYHTDLENIRQDWLLDPLFEIIKLCRQLPNNYIIGDFGCGKADLSKALGDDYSVHSFDHIAIDENVIECDIGAGVPLEDESIDFAIFSLSLMGNNWRDYLKEARRCLRPLGQLEIWTPLKQSIDDQLCEALSEANFQIILNEKRWKWRHIRCACLSS